MKCQITDCGKESYVMPEFCYLKTYKKKNNQTRTIWRKIAFCEEHFLQLLREKIYAFNLNSENDTEKISYIGFRLPLLVYDEYNLKDMEFL